ncbi:MAG: CPBP family intramembrane metalloprotease [Leptolyngbya sp. SIO4C5]|nr:CPBP family intramembrane metalloprotease [Leptolyngbya sp. SIO4C5]
MDSAVVKAFLFFVVWGGLWLPLAIPVAVVVKWRPGKPIEAAQKLPLLASLYLLAPLVVWGATRVNASSFAAYGMVWQRSLLVSLLAGLALAVAGLGLLVLIQWALGWIALNGKTNRDRSDTSTTQAETPPSLAKVVLPLLLLALWIGWTEELVFRGFLLNQLHQSYGWGLTAAIASGIFALLHLIWEGRENVPQLPGLWLMGMVLALARWADGGQLGLAWGLHAGWVWGIASLDTAAVFRPTVKSKPWLVGRPGQPLTGLMTILLMLATAGVLWQL